MPKIERLSSKPSKTAPVALILPGAGYTVQGPLLYWPVLAMTRAGWDVWSINWHADVQGPAPKDIGQFVEDAVSQALHEMPDAPTAVVGKSLGTYALPHFLDWEIQAAWITPILSDARIAEAARRASDRHLFVGGTADPTWRPEEISNAHTETIVVEDGNHSLEVPDTEWRHSATGQLEILGRLIDHLNPPAEGSSCVLRGSP
jgi:hypothetical protein